MRAAVIVVTYNHAGIVGACLRAVEATVPDGTEVIVVDNASADGTTGVVRREHPRVRVVEAPGNLGYGGGNNLGAAQVATESDVLVFLNPDAQPRPGWLEPLLAALRDDPTVGLATPKLLLARDPARIDTLGNDVHLSGITPSRKWGDPANAHREAHEVSAISGACFAVRRELFGRLGGFDERYFLYYEDTDLSLRARLAGYRCLAVPASEVLHDHRAGFPPDKLRYLERNRYWTLLKLLEVRTLVALVPTLVVAEALAWGMALKSGPAHVVAKARAWSELVEWLPGLVRARQDARVMRGVSDGELLRLHSTRLPFGQTAVGALAALAERLTSAAFGLTRAAAEKVLGSRGRVSVPAGAKERLKIAHVTATFPPYWGGTGNVAWYSARELARLGHEVHVLTAKPGGSRADRGSVDPGGVRVCRLRPLFRVGNAPLLPSLLLRLRRFDVIHLHYPFFFGAELVWLASRLFGVPYVVTYHQDVLLRGRLASIPTLHHRLMGYRILASARRLLFTTRDYGRESFAGSLATRDTAGELPNGVDTDRFRSDVDGSGIRAVHGIGGDDVLLLLVAALDQAHYFKGVEVLLHALAKGRPANVQLLVVGDGDLRGTYERLADELGLGHVVHFTGRVSDADLPKHYGAADVVVLSSTTRGEAFGVVLLEAMAAGKPVIASDLPGVRALVRDTGGGLLVVPGDAASLADAIARMAEDGALRRAHGKAGYQAVRERYAWNSIARRLERIYRTALVGVTPRMEAGRPPRPASRTGT